MTRFEEFKENFEKDLKLEVEAHVTVPEDTAFRCVELLSMYLTDNPDKTVEVYEYEGRRILQMVEIVEDKV